MANLTQVSTGVLNGDTSTVDASAITKLGTKAADTDGNEYIYLKGVASTEAGSWVSFDEEHLTTLLAANAKGRVAVAMAATVADTYGWYQVYGKNLVAKVLTGFADNAIPYCTATAGSVDDAVVAGDVIIGAVGRSAISGGVATMELNYPFVTDVIA